MFTERINELISEVCRTTTGEFSKLTGYDRSYISHIRVGDRTLKRGRGSAERLVKAVCDCAEKKNALDALRERVGAPPAAVDTELRNAVAAWLFEGQDTSQGKKSERKQRVRRSSFGSRLGLAMDLADVSAMRLARSVNVDASLIVKYRSGRRVPQMNHPIIRSLASALAARIYALERTAGLARLIGAQQEALAAESDGARLLEAWLRDFSTVDTSAIENLLEGIDAFSPETRVPLLAPEDAVDEEILNDRAEAYDGIEGIRRAVLRFLGGAVRNGWKELWLYSDQSMEWLLDDRAFAERWASLMIAYVGSGGKIRIIHNVDRGLEEMVGAIKSWLPLYVSGGIESWYSLRNGGERFTHTLFLAPENACIAGICAAGWETGARYRYVVRTDELAYHRELFEALLAECRPLLKMSRDDSADRLPAIIRDRDVHIVSRSISLGTMPEALLRAILRRAALPEETERKILADWAGRRELMAEKIAHGGLHECVALPKRETLAALGVTVDTIYAPLAYTPEEYGEHLRAALEQAEREPGYQVFLLEEPPFVRFRLAASSRVAEIVYLSGYPITFTATHPLMCRAFVDFVQRLEEHHSADRRTLEDKLKQYIPDGFGAVEGTPNDEEVPG